MKRIGLLSLLVFLVIMSPVAGQNFTSYVDSFSNYGKTWLDASNNNMPVLMGVMTDTTLSSENGKKIITGSLYDQADCWNRNKFHALSKNTSWYAELGPFPDYYSIVINNAQTAVTIYDGRDGSAWMTFTGTTSAGMYRTNGADVKLKDGILYIGAAPNYALVKIDFCQDDAVLYDSAGAGLYTWKGVGIESRNDASGWLQMGSSSGPSIVNNTVNAVAAIRDPMGAVDEFGRPKHRVAVATAGGVSVSDAGIENFYDGTNQLADGFDGATLLPDGSLFDVYKWATRELVNWTRSVQSISADGWALDEQWYNGGEGAEDLPWTDGANIVTTAAVPNASVCDGASSPVVLFGSDEGLAISHAKAGDNTNGLTTIIDNVAHWPPYRGTQKFSFALESDAELFGQDLAASGAGVTYTAGVFDNCATFDGTDYLERNADANLNLGTGSFLIEFWVKSGAAANPGASERLVVLSDGVVTDEVIVFFENDGHFTFRATDDSYGTYDEVHFAQDIYDAAWHHIAALRDDGNNMYLYVDGELVGSDTFGSAAGSIDPVNLKIGASDAGATQFTGSIDHLYLWVGAYPSAAEIKREYHKGERAMQSTVAQQHFDAADIDYVQTSPTGAYRVVGNQSKLYILDDHDIIVETHASPGGNIQDVAVWETPGTTDYGLAIATSTHLQWIQPDIRIAEVGGRSQTEIVAPRARIDHFFGPSNVQPSNYCLVDSAGHGDFTQIDYAIDSGYLVIEVAKGTYDPVEADVANLVIFGHGRSTIIDGGTTAHALNVTGADVQILNIAVKTTNEGGNPYDALVLNGARGHAEGVIALTSDQYGFHIGATGDDSRITGCASVDSQGDAVYIDADGENCIISGCRLQAWTGEAIDDDSGTSVHANLNDETP